MTQKLTESWAQKLFYGGSVLFLFLLLAMTFDTSLILGRRGEIGVPGLNFELVQVLTQGKFVWEKNNCVGCHTLVGEGAYFASELGNVYQRYEKNIKTIKEIIQHPPGNGMQWRRSMPQFDFTEQELDALVEFLKYSSEVKTANWPPHQEG